MRRLAMTLALLTACQAGAIDLRYRPAREERSITTAMYQIGVQKNGHVSVFLTSHEPVFLNARPMVWLEGESKPSPFDLDGRRSTREHMDSVLGQGQRMVLTARGCVWEINAHIGQPFVTARLTYINTRKKPVRVRMLSPWSTTPVTGRVSVGEGTAECAVLTAGRWWPVEYAGKKKDGATQLLSVPPREERRPGLSAGEGTSDWTLALSNAETGQSVVAGFLSFEKGYGTIGMAGREVLNTDFSQFRMECVYDPPVELAPGERMESELIYLAVAERSPHVALERYGHAVAAMNRVPASKTIPTHGWDVSAALEPREVTVERVLREAAIQEERLGRYGWRHIDLGTAWAVGPGRWRPDPERFPDGVAAVAKSLHEKGMTLGIAIDPFLVARDESIAREHPEWLLRRTPAMKSVLEDNQRMLDVTRPETAKYVHDLCARMRDEWGVDSLTIKPTARYLVLAERYFDKSATRLEVLRMGSKAVYEGFGERNPVTMPPPAALGGLTGQAVTAGVVPIPMWDAGGARGWGCRQALANAARSYFHAPYLYLLDPGPAFFPKGGANTPVTWEESLAWYTGLALCSGVIDMGDPPSTLDEARSGVLRRLTPSPRKPARPLDLFSGEPPRVWILPVDCAIGKWLVLAVFNWGAEKDEVTLPFAALGLTPDRYQTVFGFWEQHYYGAVKESLSLEVPPRSVRLLALKPYRPTPMLLGTDSHFSQGATDFTELEWDAATRTLSGTFTGVGATPYVLSILVPDKYTVGEVTASSGPAETRMQGRVLRIKLDCAEDGPVSWKAAF